VGATNRTEIRAFAAAPDGRLTAIPGSPFAGDVTFMAVNGLYLFGAGTAGTYIHAYSIQRDGTLRYVAASNVVQPNNAACDSPGALLFDHTGATLYNLDEFASSCANAAYQGFTVRKSNGQLDLVNEAEVGISGAILSFIGNNKFAYGADCMNSSPRIYGFTRDTDGSLKKLKINAPLPSAPENQTWCPAALTADSANHLAVPLVPLSGSQQSGPVQLATYTAREDGALATSSTATNMPRVAIGNLTTLAMAPSGKLLAVAGDGGLQLFRFNGADPITPYTAPFLRQEVDQLFWDNNNHLYAIGQSAGKLWVFTVTTTGYSLAPGSPYSVNDPQNIAIQSWPSPWSTLEDRAAKGHPDPAGALPATVASIH
jgi:6-phosphogluconolactonase (cycloisomerase 2 family)